jgi:hypothetical protein
MEVQEDGTVEKQGEAVASVAAEGIVGLSNDGSSSGCRKRTLRQSFGKSDGG